MEKAPGGSKGPGVPAAGHRIPRSDMTLRRGEGNGVCPGCCTAKVRDLTIQILAAIYLSAFVPGW